MFNNRVIAGDYVGERVIYTFSDGMVIETDDGDIPINKETVESHEIITEDIAKSAASGVSRGLVGGLLLGPVGALAGTLSAKSDGNYTIAIKFKDGKTSLVQVDAGKRDLLVRSFFNAPKGKQHPAKPSPSQKKTAKILLGIAFACLALSIILLLMQ